jgi:DNA-binding NarL/FixJ family response regulator
VASVARPADALRAARDEKVDAVVLELSLGTPACDRAIEGLRQLGPAPRIIGLHKGGVATISRARDMEVTAVHLASGGFEPLLQALRQPAMNRGRAVRAADCVSYVEDLTDRQREILELLASGRTAAKISEHLDISPKTVEGHKQRLFEKLGAANQAHAVALAMRSGLLRPTEPARRIVNG